AALCAVVWAAAAVAVRPTVAWTAVLGVACGAAAATKATTLGAVPIAAAVAAWAWTRRVADRRVLTAVAAVVVLGVAAAATLWALYGFTGGAVDVANPCPVGATTSAGAGVMQAGAGWWPFPAWIEGLAFQLRHGREGHLGYLAGEVRTTGWWWFYLACLALKLTIAAQALVALRVAALAWQRPALRSTDAGSSATAD